MAVIRDVMPAFELLQPTSAADAQKLLAQHGPDAWIMAGGLDSFDWLKDRIKKPKVVVDLSGVAELRGVRNTTGGIEIGAMTTLTEVVRDPTVRQKYSLLAQAAELVASPQIRNQGTIGGNVSQDARCWYYRAGWPCYRAGGNICYADTPEGRNREHAILHAERCVAVNPSDTAPALIALDAKFVMRTPKGERIVDAEKYFIGPDIDITNTQEVLWALATRCIPEHAVKIIAGTAVWQLDPRIPPLDRSSPDKGGRKRYRAHNLVINACRPYEWKDEFPKVNVNSRELRESTEKKWQTLFQGI